MTPLRPWHHSRQAYIPRPWVSVVLTVVAAYALTLVVHGWARTAGAVAVAFAITGAQWGIWTRRHPRIARVQILSLQGSVPALTFRDRPRRDPGNVVFDPETRTLRDG